MFSVNMNRTGSGTVHSKWDVWVYGQVQLWLPEVLETPDKPLHVVSARKLSAFPAGVWIVHV